jgi:hypothetical protein
MTVRAATTPAEASASTWNTLLDVSVPATSACTVPSA